MKYFIIALTCTLILAGLFTFNNIVDFYSQDASAAPTGMNEVAMKVKLNSIKGPGVSDIEYLKSKIYAERALLNILIDTTNLKVVTYNKEHPNSEWTIYFLLNREPNGIVGMSITLTHHDRFVMNHIKVSHADKAAEFPTTIRNMIEMVSDVIRQKLKNKDAPIIVTDKPTIAID